MWGTPSDCSITILQTSDTIHSSIDSIGDKILINSLSFSKGDIEDEADESKHDPSHSENNKDHSQWKSYCCYNLFRHTIMRNTICVGVGVCLYVCMCGSAFACMYSI